MILKLKLFLIGFFVISLTSVIEIYADDFQFNNYNNHGVVGIINMPTARTFNAGVH